MTNSFAEELIQSVDEEGRDGYRNTLENIGQAEGRNGYISDIAIRVVKGIQRLNIGTAKLTTEGLATSDGMIQDCGAAMVRLKNGVYERYVGKTSAHPTRLFSSYDSDEQQFALWSEGRTTVKRYFQTTDLAPREGDIVQAKFGKEILEGVLEDGPITDHIRRCLRNFEEDVQSIGLLLRHPTFHRFSDTRQEGVDGIQTLFTDGSQIHIMNNRTVYDRQNKSSPREMTMENYRPGIVIDGEEMMPNIEDRIGRIIVHTREGDVPLDFTALTPRCLTPQRDVITGEVQAEPKLWLRKNQPRRPWDNVATMGANVDMPPEFDGAVIRVGDRFTVESEKTAWHQ